MYDRSRVTIDARMHPYNAGTEHVGVSPSRQVFACTKRGAP